MKDRFIKLWNRIGAQGNAEEAFAKLAAMYAEPQRFYHNMDHIKNCLIELDSARSLVQKPDLVEFDLVEFDLVELAIWHHDAIYNTQSKKNEKKSAQLAYDVCLSAQLPKEFAKGAKNLIWTPNYVKSSSGIDKRVFMDIDYSILGKPPEEFNNYEKNIRKEYQELIQNLSEMEFKVGRYGVLSDLLQRAEKNELYLTDFFRNKYEEQAKVNLQRSINALRYFSKDEFLK